MRFTDHLGKAVTAVANGPWTELWLVRHGESIGNVAASAAEERGDERIPLDIRDADVPLSPTGLEQAAALAAWLEGRRSELSTYWCSPYLRARQTLDAALGDDAAGIRVSVDERLRDRELGILDLLTTTGVATIHPDEVARRQHLGKFYHRPPGGESWADVALRLRSFVSDATSPGDTDADAGADAGAEGAGGAALIVAHDAVVMLFLYLCLEMSEADLLDFAQSHTVANASLTHLARRSSAHRWELVDFSNVDHLSRRGAPVTVHPGDDDVQPE